MIEVKVYICSYCGGCLTSDYNLITEHEKRCNLNPNRTICSCLSCIHGDVFRKEEAGYKGRKITRAYAKCNKGVGNKFDYTHDYCESFIAKKSEFLICMERIEKRKPSGITR